MTIKWLKIATKTFCWTNMSPQIVGHKWHLVVRLSALFVGLANARQWTNRILFCILGSEKKNGRLFLLSGPVGRYLSDWTAMKTVSNIKVEETTHLSLSNALKQASMFARRVPLSSTAGYCSCSSNWVNCPSSEAIRSLLLLLHGSAIRAE